AFPHPQDRERLTQHFRFIEKDVADSAAQQHAKKRRPGNEIADLLRWQVAVAALREQANDEIGGKKREHIGKSIPARPDVFPKPEDERIEIIDEIRKHRGESSRHPERSRGIPVASPLTYI